MAYTDLCKDERRVINRLIRCALHDWTARISVSDEEEEVLPQSDSLIAIKDAIAHTDATWLRIWKGPADAPISIGSIMLVHGNGEDVIADYTSSNTLDNIVEVATEWGDR